MAFNKKHKFKDKFSQIKYIIGYGKEPVKERMLHGNSFRIVIRNLKNALADDLLNYISSYRYYYFVNYYDNQRFGMPCGPYNTHLIGEAIAKDNWELAYKHIKITNNDLPKTIIKEESLINFKEIFKSMNPKKISFFVSSYNSFLWNKQASLIVKKYTKSKQHSFENVGQLYIPISYLLRCPNMCEIEGFEFATEKFSVRQQKYSRNIFVATTVYAHNIENDELYKDMKKLTLSFFLPTGSYATMVVKQIFLRLNEK